MAVTFTEVATPSGQTAAPARVAIYDLTFAHPADDYATGGYAVALRDLIGYDVTPYRVEAFGYVTTTEAWDGYIWKYNAVSDQMLAYTMTAGAELGAGADLSANTVRLIVYSY